MGPNTIKDIIKQYTSIKYNEVDIVAIPKRSQNFYLINLKLNEAEYIMEVLAFGRIDEKLESIIGASNLQLKMTFNC
jgi:hypothetical protein